MKTDELWNAVTKPASPRDWTEEEKQYILEHPDCQYELIYWLECNSSDHCWTEANYNFAKEIQNREYKKK